jgi:hypothetical protein
MRCPLSDAFHSGIRSPLDGPSYPQTPTEDAWGRPGGKRKGSEVFQDGASLCARCRRLTTHFDVYESAEDGSKDPNLVCQKAAAELSQLSDTLRQLRAGMSTSERGVLRVSSPSHQRYHALLLLFLLTNTIISGLRAAWGKSR